MDNNNSDIIEIDLLKIFELLLSKLWAILIIAFLFAGAAFSYAYYLVVPRYESTAMFYVNNNNFSLGSFSYSISSSDISASQSLVDTYIVILKTRNTLETVIEKSGVDYSYGQLVGMISASSVNSTEVFKVTVNSTDPREACVIANTIANVLPDKISEIVTGSGAKVVDYAVVNTNKVSPSVSKYSIIGFLIGVVFTSAIIILKDYFDDTIRDESDITERFENIPILAVIPNLNGKIKSSYYKKGYGYKKNYYRYGYGEDK